MGNQNRIIQFTKIATYTIYDWEEGRGPLPGPLVLLVILLVVWGAARLGEVQLSLGRAALGEVA